MFNHLRTSLVRWKSPVRFQDLVRTTPISSSFGLDRGIPIDRYYIENFLHRNSQLIAGDVLEIGDTCYSKRYGGNKVKSIHALHTNPDDREATIIGDLTDPSTLPQSAMDCFICTQTFNFIFDVQKAVAGAHYLLKPGGVLLATVAGICQISRYDMDRWGDYWRFTTASVKKLFEPVFTGGVMIESSGNVMAACAFLQGVAIEDLPDRSLLDTHDPDYQIIITILARKAF